MLSVRWRTAAASLGLSDSFSIFRREGLPLQAARNTIARKAIHRFLFVFSFLFRFILSDLFCSIVCKVKQSFADYGFLPEVCVSLPAYLYDPDSSLLFPGKVRLHTIRPAAKKSSSPIQTEEG